jgi:hypothetical protein
MPVTVARRRFGARAGLDNVCHPGLEHHANKKYAPVPLAEFF